MWIEYLYVYPFGPILVLRKQNLQRRMHVFDR